MGTEPPVDGITWLQVRLNGASCLLFQTEPYIPVPGRFLAAKLIYLSTRPYGTLSLERMLGRFGLMYSVTISNEPSGTRYAEDSEIQAVARAAGLSHAQGIHGNLSLVPSEAVSAELPSVPLLSRFQSAQAESLAREVARAYGVDEGRLRVTGGAQLNDRPLDRQHDLDVVVPIDSADQALQVWRGIRSREAGMVVEHGCRSPVRWRSNDSTLVCPFFVYGNMRPPVCDVSIGAQNVAARLLVVDARYSIFNMPILETAGSVEFVLFRNRVIRSMFREGSRLSVTGRLVTVTQGSWTGRRGVLVTDVHHQLRDVDSLLEYWSA